MHVVEDQVLDAIGLEPVFSKRAKPPAGTNEAADDGDGPISD
jgi:hypothetical protein